jgi:hypothetical protein
MEIAKTSQLPRVILYICFKKKKKKTYHPRKLSRMFSGHKEQKHNFPITVHTESETTIFGIANFYLTFTQCHCYRHM